MASADGKRVITLNGEIYNYRALRAELEAQGCVFRTESDTEVLLHLYAAKGPAMVHDLRGMFAFALWDAEKCGLLLARDPYGIKPLYYADDGWTFRFASQVKALLAGGRVSLIPEPAGWAGFLLFGNVPEPYRKRNFVPICRGFSTRWTSRRSTGSIPGLSARRPENSASRRLSRVSAATSCWAATPLSTTFPAGCGWARCRPVSRFSATPSALYCRHRGCAHRLFTQRPPAG